MTGRRHSRGDHGSVRRPLLTTIVALGSVISIAGTTGVFAVFTDRATTGQNSFGTKGLAKAAGLQLANGTPAGNTITCGTYTDDLATGIMTFSNAEPGQAVGTDFLCLKNTGSQTVDVTTTAYNIADRDSDCTGNEDAVDATCGENLDGELSPLMDIRVVYFGCDDSTQFTQKPPVALSDLTNETIQALAPDEVLCLNYGVFYSPTEAEAQVAQSDTVTWRFALDGTVPSV